MIYFILFTNISIKLTSASMAEWGSRQAHLNEVGNFLIESTDPQTSRSLAEELRKVNMQWAEFVKKNTLVSQRSRKTRFVCLDSKTPLWKIIWKCLKTTSHKFFVRELIRIFS